MTKLSEPEDRDSGPSHKRRRRRRRRRARVGLPAAVGLAFTVALASAPPLAVRAADTPSPVCSVRTTPISQGPATLVSESVVANTGGRVTDVVLNSPALPGHTHVYVLVPRGYDASGRTRYPVLYLLHGASGAYTDWITQGNAEQIIDDVSQQKGLPPFITVMPDGGTWGFYSDWYGANLTDTSGAAPPAWTSYHVDELVPWIDAHYPTLPQRESRAIAGLSMGGFGTMSYAARYPDLFVAAGSFSGAVDPDVDYPAGPAGLTAASSGFTGGQPQMCVWGDWQTQDVRWRGDNPTYLAENLSHTVLYVASGGSDATHPVATDPIEESVYLMSKSLVAALDAHGIPHTDNFYGAGTHSWSYWQTDLRAYLPIMAGALAHPPAAPPAVPFSYQSIAPRFSVYGWSFATDHQVTEFTYLTDVSRSGFTAAGSGTLRVVTAALYAPGASYAVSAGSSSGTVMADQTGRLSFSVELGKAHTTEQATFAPADIASWTHATASIAPLARATSPPAGSGASAASAPLLPNTAPGDAARSGLAAALAAALGAAVRVFGRRRRFAPPPSREPPRRS